MDVKPRQHSEKDKSFILKTFQTSEYKENFTYTLEQEIGSGSFGKVFRARCDQTGETVAIKTVYQDTRYKNRELQILKELNHPNVIQILHSYFTQKNNEEVYLNVVMDYIPTTLSSVIRACHKTQNENLNFLAQVKLYSFQILRAINYLSALGICHRDIKPHNILINTGTNELKVCDFGSAKKLVKGDINVSYICSRYYRAPELIFGAVDYSFPIDIWSVGCVIAELVLGRPLFPGESSVDQIFEIIKVLGTPSRKQIAEMNPNYEDYKFPAIRSFTWSQIFQNKMNVIGKDFIDLISKLIVYEPSKRLLPIDALMHPFFDDLRDESFHCQGNIRIPPSLFQFTNEEVIQDTRNLISSITPEWYDELYNE